MKNLLIIFNVAAEDDRCRLFLPYWRQSGCDLLFSSPLDAISKLEGVDHFHAGRAIGPGRNTWWHLQSRVFDTMKYCLTLPYDGYLFTQYDSIALGKLPEIGPDDSVHNLAGGPQPGFRGSFFLHPPWCFGRNRLRQFVEAASKHPIDIEKGYMDLWLSFIIETSGIPYVHASWSWSSNAIDCPALVESARRAVQNGFLFVHGVKNKAQLDAILAP